MLLVYSIVFSICLYQLTCANSITQRSEENRLPSEHCSPWSHFNSDTDKCESYKHVTCINGVCSIPVGHCMTYDERKETLSYVICPFLHRNLTDNFAGIYLPNNISELNSYMCSSKHRKGQVCSECIDGFGPSLTSLGHECQNCSGKWYGLFFFFLLEFGPITVFFVIVVVFQISFTSAPVTSFIMYSQIIMYELIISRHEPMREAILAEGGSFPALVRVITTFYGIWNLDFFWYIVPPFCVNSNLKLIDLLFIRQICAFYPFLLIVITWLCIELHGHNFRPLVFLCSPFRRCVTRLWRAFNAKNDLVAVFSSFFCIIL